VCTRMGLGGAVAGLSLSACSHSPLAYVGHLASQRQSGEAPPPRLRSPAIVELSEALRAKADKARARARDPAAARILDYFLRGFLRTGGGSSWRSTASIRCCSSSTSFSRCSVLTRRLRASARSSSSSCRRPALSANMTIRFPVRDTRGWNGDAELSHCISSGPASKVPWSVASIADRCHVISGQHRSGTTVTRSSPRRLLALQNRGLREPWLLSEGLKGAVTSKNVPKVLECQIFAMTSAVVGSVCP
jgi:hypothetical protein